MRESSSLSISIFVDVVKLADTTDSKSVVFIREGSNPSIDIVRTPEHIQRLALNQIVCLIKKAFVC